MQNKRCLQLYIYVIQAIKNFTAKLQTHPQPGKSFQKKSSFKDQILDFETKAAIDIFNLMSKYISWFSKLCRKARNKKQEKEV
jgi:hypothetical protein